ncbi:MAG: FAD-binding oxidoreductase [Lewinella sp.]|nr:FAD-binding oxidoreductase [Lewinella sp.]
MMPKYDFLIVGGGIFGIYAALFLAEQHDQRVLLLEKETALLKKASVVNQARLHGGYHYPRSVATARMSDENKARFTADHRDFILFDFEKYYAIDRFSSLTDAAQFERFCAYIGIPCDRVADHPLFNYHRLEAVYKTVEYTFDPILIAQYYRERLLAEHRIEVRMGTRVQAAGMAGTEWEVTLERAGTGEASTVRARQVINATYSATNAVNALFGQPPIALMHEITEMAFVTSPQLANTGLTIMDGPFGSIMPYGKSGLLSLSSVPYTHHKVSYEAAPVFDCQARRSDCSPGAPAICTGCPVVPPSNYAKMKAQIMQYLSSRVELHYFTSTYTIKSKLQASYIDDGRPTEISVMRRAPHFYCIFAGKINSIYEIEKVLEL